MVERTLPKPDTRVRFPSAAPKAPDFVAGLFPRLKRESLPGGNTFPRALGISAFQPVSRSPQAPDLTVWGFIFWVGCGGWAKGLGCGLGRTGRGGMFLAPAGNPSSLRFGHPDVATEHTGLSPTPFSLPLREGGVVGAGCVGSKLRVARLGKSVRGGGEGNTGVRHRRQLTGRHR